jgi:hypothetical protein
MPHGDHFSYQINSKQAFTGDPTPTSSQILSDAGFEPADDFSLVQRTQHGSRLLASDEVVDVREGAAEFFAFSGGVTFECTVNSHSIFWGDDKIEIPQLRRLANVADDHDLVWVREESQNEVLPLEGHFPLSGRGVEHLRTHKRAVEPTVYEYFVAGVKYTTEHERLTGAQITAKLPDWNPANSLVLESEGAEPDEIVHPTTVVELKGRATPAHFAVVPPATFGRV